MASPRSPRSPRFNPFRPRPARVATLLAGAIVGTLLLAGCTRDGKFVALSMWNEARLKPYEPIAGTNLSASRPIPAGTVAVGTPYAGDPLLTGRAGGKLMTTYPFPVTEAVVARGQARFNIYCSPCHGRAGDGQGLVVKRGFPHPPDYKIPRLVKAPVGHFFDVQTHGWGAMYSYADRVAPTDRWAIAAYIRVLQRINRPVTPEETWIAERRRARDLVGRPVRDENLPRGAAPSGEGAGIGPDAPPGTPSPTTIDPNLRDRDVPDPTVNAP